MINRFISLALRPLMLYAVFSGRSGRVEFWTFIVMTPVLIKLVSIVTLTGSYLIGYEHEYQLRFHSHFKDGTSLVIHSPEPTSRAFEGENKKEPAPNEWRNAGDPYHFKFSDIVLEVHRHDEITGYHLHVGVSDRVTLANDHVPNSRFTIYTMLEDESPQERIKNQTVTLVWLLLIIPLLAVGARRLHDTGKSGRWLLLGLVPVAGWLVLAIFFALEGDKHPNRYGKADTP